MEQNYHTDRLMQMAEDVGSIKQLIQKSLEIQKDHKIRIGRLESFKIKATAAFGVISAVVIGGYTLLHDGVLKLGKP